MAKKKQDFSKVEFFSYEEGLCVQCMHIGAYDDEPNKDYGGIKGKRHGIYKGIFGFCFGTIIRTG